MLTLLAKLELERLDGAGEEVLELPQTSVELYDQAIRLLLRRGHGAEPSPVRDKIAARKILRTLSLRLQHDEVEAWDLEEELYPALLEVLGERDDLERMVRLSWGGAESFLEDIGRSSGILADCDGPGTPWRYMHKSLREYERRLQGYSLFVDSTDDTVGRSSLEPFKKRLHDLARNDELLVTERAVQLFEDIFRL